MREREWEGVRQRERRERGKRLRGSEREMRGRRGWEIGRVGLQEGVMERGREILGMGE